ncbi:helix-turn-helix domain-containing protein [Paenibacillus sp. GCM10023252]|uniref:helix-turn-helix transcriptional regulator n=1 Tax=Paenibacillus sp. GCM10023252 TaxID=3252649 RepID=UPI00361FEC41
MKELADKHELLMTLSPYIRRALNHRVTNMRLRTRIIFDYELLYMERGELHIRVEDVVHELQEGDWILLKPGVEHEFVKSSAECWKPHIHFDPIYLANSEQVPINFKPRSECTTEEIAYIRQDVLGEILEIPTVLRIPSHKELHKLLTEIFHAQALSREERIIIEKMCVLRMLHIILQDMNRGKSKEHLTHQKGVETAAAYLMVHFAEAVSLEELAKLACLSIYHFSRLFKVKYGISPHQYLIRCRMEKAKELMLYSQASLTAVAEQVGYSTLFSFSKAFKQAEGLSPKHFQMKHGV